MSPQAELASAAVPAHPATRSADLGPGGSRDIALIDLLDRLLGGGVVLTGEITLAVADIDLVQVALRALISSVSTLNPEKTLSHEKGTSS